MNVTHHWSGSTAQRENVYGIEMARNADLDPDYLHVLRADWDNPNGACNVDFDLLHSKFTIWKNMDLTVIPGYGTWNWNADPRNGNTPNYCVASMTLPHGATDFSGVEPFTIAHAWCHAYVSAIIAHLKGLDIMESWANPDTSTYQNGPMYTFDTHGCRALQTVNWNVPGAGASSQLASQTYGYFFGSGDPESRADLFCLDAQYYNGTVQIAQAQRSSAQIRNHAHVIKGANRIGNLWGIDGPVTP